jgi:hypothetical protein
VNISLLAKKFSDYHNSGLSKGQALMIEDGMPAALAMSADERAAARNLNSAITTMPGEPVVNRLVPQETEQMKKIALLAKKASSKKSIHIPRKPKANPKLPATHPANRGAKKTTVQARRALKPTTERSKNRVPGVDVAEFTCVAAGVTMEMLVKKFGIEAHPMRAKIHYAKHQLGYTIENRDGRYFGTRPVAK